MALKSMTGSFNNVKELILLIVETYLHANLKCMAVRASGGVAGGGGKGEGRGGDAVHLSGARLFPARSGGTQTATAMSGFVGVLVSDQWLQSQFTQVELRGLRSSVLSVKRESGHVTVADLPATLAKNKRFSEKLTEEEIAAFLAETYPNTEEEIDFEAYLRVCLNLQGRVHEKLGHSKHASAFLKAATTTLLICIRLANPRRHLIKLINVAVPGTIDERAINTKKVLNPWERNENHTLCLNSAKAIGCTVVNIGTQDLVEGRIQLLADLNLRKTPQLVELVDDSKDVEELMGLSPEKILLRWMNFHLKKAGYKKNITNFSSDVKLVKYTVLDVD
ncbi:hypothetical protein EJ110_NYTH49278 [Nymphaea thermarum]|nr:hypothetical protein EJ110_NYTH49278 [Nymphaea thermarum]